MTNEINEMTFVKNEDGSVSSKINGQNVGRGKNKKAVDVDSEMSSTSENPVQNKIIDDALEKKADLVNGKVPETQLPSYVDDVLEYASVSSFPSTGESGKIYVALDTNITYRWSGSAYVQVGPEGDVVIANPTLVGTEDELTGLQVGETKYKVPGGGSGDKLYEHNIKIAKSDFQIYIKVYSTLSTAFTQTDLENYFEERKNTFLTCSGYNEAYGVKEAYVGYIYPVDKYNVRIYYTDLTDFNSDKVVNMANISKDTSNATISDTVIQVANTINVASDNHLYCHRINIGVTVDNIEYSKQELLYLPFADEINKNNAVSLFTQYNLTTFEIYVVTGGTYPGQANITPKYIKVTISSTSLTIQSSSNGWGFNDTVTATSFSDQSVKQLF